MKPIRWRLIFVTVLTLLAVYAVSPTLIYFMQPVEVRVNEEAFKSKVPSWLPSDHVKLGLDLQGGVQLILGVNTTDAISNKLGRIAVELSRWALDNDLGVETAYVGRDGKQVKVQLKSEQNRDDFHMAFVREFPILSKQGVDDQLLVYGIKDSELDRIRDSALKQAEKVIRTRVDAWGVSEPMINRRGDGSILVQLPGFRDPEKAKALLGRTAILNFKIVDDEFKGFDELRGKVPEGIRVAQGSGQLAFVGEDREELEQFLQPHVPEDRQLLFQRELLGDGSKARYRFTSFVVHAATSLVGDDILDANFNPQAGIERQPSVSLKLTALGGKRFAEVTGANVGKRLGIELDGLMMSAPVIKTKISGGEASIELGNSGSYSKTVEEGTELALILKSGAVPATITVLQQRTVGATLGPELANQGLRGIALGLILVLIFMLVYYRRPGMIACVALMLNGLFLLAVMAGFGFALTLPGIAGFVLTLGMAVDANVLINERIRQEVREGKHPRVGVQTGFKKVFWTIVDANVTTLIAALVLLETNPSGPIRGFAVTLMIGLIVSLFTSLYCSHLLFDIALLKVADKKLRKWLGVAVKGGAKKHEPKFHFDFLKSGKGATIGFAAIGLAALLMTSVKGLNFGVDFAGGTEVQLGFASDVEPDVIRDIAEKQDLDGFSIQALGTGGRQYLLRYDEGADDSEGKSARASETFLNFKTALLEDLAANKPDIQSVDFVGPQIGKELRNRGIISVLYAIVAVLLYIALRFDMRFAPGAVVKMFMDIFVMLGFYAFFGASFDLVAVAAFLTVVGYSVNDTIVIYDRIRENLGQNARRSLRENINFSLNETLSRTINTSLTTVAALVGILAFGTGNIWTFAMAMAIGVVVATFSSTFVASSFVLWLEGWRKKRGVSGRGKSAARA